MVVKAGKKAIADGVILFGVVGASSPIAHPPVRFRNVGLEYLAVMTGRACNALEVTSVIQAHYEIRYECDLNIKPIVPPPYKSG